MASIRFAVPTFLLVAAQGCVITWGGSVEHRPAIQSELEANHRPVTARSSWAPDYGGVRERAILDATRDASPRDDSPSWQGPSHLAGASGVVDGKDLTGRAERDALVKANDEKVKEDAKAAAAKPTETRPGDLERALGTWEEWKAEHGVPPIELPPPVEKPPPVKDDKKGP